LELAGVLPRHDPVDLLISKTARSLADVPLHSIVATSSNRRARQLCYRRPDFIISDIRGNVTTRLSKLFQNEHWNAIILAKAGLERLGFRLEQGLMEFESQALFASDLIELLPAVGQGAIGLEIALPNAEVKAAIEKINDPLTWFCVTAERELLRMIGGGCQTPLGVRTRFRKDVLHFDAIVFGKESKPLTGTVTGLFSTPADAATALYTSIYGKQS
jgi:hydroxymethylbilane synthase